MLDRAIALDPSYAQAHAWKACVLGQAWTTAVRGPRRDFGADGGRTGTALSLDDNDSDVHRILAAVNLNRDEHDKAAFHQERALSLNPNDDLVVVQQGELLTWLGRPDEGIAWIRRRCASTLIIRERFWNHLGRAQYTRASLCRRHRILQQAHGAGSHPSCLSRRIVGAVGQRHRRRCPCARSAATATDLQHRELPENASLSAARGQRTPARRAAESGAARVIGYRLRYSLADYLADCSG